MITRGLAGGNRVPDFHPGEIFQEYALLGVGSDGTLSIWAIAGVVEHTTVSSATANANRIQPPGEPRNDK